MALTRCFGKLTAVDALDISVEADDLCNRVAIMHQGKVMASGTPVELKASIGGNGATLEQVFSHYAGATLESGGSYRETFRTRRTAQRLG